MELGSARDLKLEVAQEIIRPAVLAAQSAGRFGVRARAMRSVGATRSMAIGVGGEKGDYKLAIRLQRRSLEEDEALLRAITERAKGEVDIQYIGRVLAANAPAPVVAQAVPWHRKRQRPLLIGSSIGHRDITAGTLGAFVETGLGQPAILSNNHVLANENAGAPGDDIWQPGRADGGGSTAHMGDLLNFEPLLPGSVNFIDAAVCSIIDGVDADRSQLKGLGTLRGLRTSPLSAGDQVAKVGRTTGVTQGKVRAVELDNVTVEYDIGVLRFDNQIEIEGAGDKAFSAGGDSGSVIVDEDFNACALLFAGGDQGGSNGKGLTYANPLPLVLDTLGVRLVN